MKQFLQTRICALAIFLLFNKPAVPQELNVKCPSFTHFSNGRIICSNSNNIGSICYFYCNETYELNGDSNTVCHSGIWSNSKPSCFRSFSTEPPILCHILQSFSNGEVSCTNGNHAGSVCSYTCFLGYKLVGNQQTVCHFQGWSATPPVCKKSTQVAARIGSCTPLQHPFHGHFTCSNAYHFLSSCIFSCQNYYKLKGSPNTRCLYSGWTNQPPQCTRDLAIKGRNTFCAYEPYPLASRVTCTDARNSGSVCTYTCIELFELSGSATRTCVSGSWDNPQPSCSAMTSSIPAGGCSPIPLGQSVEQSCTNGISAGSECTFSCSTPTLTLNGIDKTTCYNGLWSESSYPFCTVQTSSACPSITNGPGVQMSCSDDYNANSICSFTCAGDRTLSGPETVTCQQSYWTEPSPICLASLGCQVLANPANALLSCTNGNSINSVCTFSCLPPYKMNGEPIITCQSSRSWVPDPPACYTPSCSILTSPADGLVSCSNANLFESVCTFTCNEGASLTGEAVLTCSNAGKWSHPKPTCSGKCSELGELENGQISCANEYNVGTACVFSCADGYSVRGEPVTTCTPEKTWSDPPPTCFNRESVRCHPLLSELFKTGLTCTNLNKIDSTCDLKCEDGTSQEKFFCREAVNDDGAAWFHKDACEAGGSKVKLCEAALFDVITVIDGSFTEAQFTDAVKLLEQMALVFREHFVKKQMRWSVATSGAKTDSCNLNDKVSSYNTKIPFGRHNTSTLFKMLKQIQKPDSCAYYSTPLTEATAALTTHGQTLAIPVLLHMSAGDISSAFDVAKDIRDGGIRIFALGTGSTTMEMVKTLTGSANTAFWVSDTEKLSDKYIPISDTLRSLDCAGTGCPKTFTDFANGKHSCRYLRGSGTACVFECDLGFKLKGARVLRCLERKGDDPEKWSRPQPTCEVALCYELEPVKFGGMNCSDGVKPGSVCVFHCDEYYFREGPTQVECGKLQSGEWSEASATCATDLLCLPALQKIENGELQCPDGNQFNAVCTYKCTEGFLLSGSHKLRCSTPLQEGGAAWNKKPPKCVKCPITPCALDIVVAVDSSEYMQEEKFKETITAVENLLNRFDGSIDQGIAHAGLIQVNGKPTFDCLSSYVDKKLKVELDLAEYSIEQVIEALKNTSSKFGCPTVESAIARGASYIKAVGRENTKRVLILVTDADVSTEKFSEVAAKTQQEEGVRVIVVGRDTSGESTDVVVKGLNRHGRLVVTPSFVGTTTPIEELILTFTNRASGFKQPCGWLGYFALYVLIRALSR